MDTFYKYGWYYDLRREYPFSNFSQIHISLHSPNYFTITYSHALLIGDFGPNCIHFKPDLYAAIKQGSNNCWPQPSSSLSNAICPNIYNTTTTNNAIGFVIIKINLELIWAITEAITSRGSHKWLFRNISFEMMDASNLSQENSSEEQYSFILENKASRIEGEIYSKGCFKALKNSKTLILNPT